LPCVLIFVYINYQFVYFLTVINAVNGLKDSKLSILSWVDGIKKMVE